MHKHGFTLVEVLVVVVIIGILACIAVPNLFGTVAKAKGAEVQAASGSYIHLQDAYVTENSAVGNWNDIGYEAPSGGETSTFSYSQGDITSAKKLENMTTTQIGWSATNLVNLNDCKQKNYWSISITNVDGKQVSYKSSVSAAECVPIVSGWDSDASSGAKAASSFESGKSTEEATPASSSAKIAAASSSSHTLQEASVPDETEAAVTTSSASTKASSSSTVTVAANTGSNENNSTTKVETTSSASTGDVGNDTGSGSGSGSGGESGSDESTGGNDDEDGSVDDDESVAENSCDAQTEASISEAQTEFNKAQQKRATDFEKAQAQRKADLEDLNNQIASVTAQLNAPACGTKEETFDCHYEGNAFNRHEVCKTRTIEDNNDNCLTAGERKTLEQNKTNLSNRYDQATYVYNQKQSTFDAQQATYQTAFNNQITSTRAKCQESNQKNCTSYTNKNGKTKYKDCKNSSSNNGGWNSNWNKGNNNNWGIGVDYSNDFGKPSGGWGQSGNSWSGMDGKSWW